MSLLTKSLQVKKVENCQLQVRMGGGGGGYRKNHRGKEKRKNLYVYSRKVE